MPNDISPPALGDLTWTAARDLLRLNPVGLLPVGAIEAHGPHLPLNTDVIIAEAMARRAGSLLYQGGLPAVMLPSVSYSVSFAGAVFPGTCPVSGEALETYLEEILEGAARQGYRLICVCNAHLEPAHVEAVSTSVDRANQAVSIPITFPDKRQDAWAKQLGEEFHRGSRHAGWYETSIILAERPDLVRRERLEELKPNWIDLPAALRAGARNFAEAGADLAYFGDPAAATAEDGYRLIDTLGTLVRDHIIDTLARDTSN